MPRRAKGGGSEAAAGLAQGRGLEEEVEMEESTAARRATATATGPLPVPLLLQLRPRRPLPPPPEARQQQREQAAGSAANGAAVSAPSSGQDETMAEAEAAPAAAEEAAAAEAVPQETDPAGAEEQGTANEAQQVPALGGLPARDPRCWPCAEAMPFTSCLIAASSLDSTELLKMVFPLLSPSASFVVTGTWMQPLAESMVAMRDGGYAVNLAVQEAWWRQHQVLPMRTHPLVNMNHGGGYILSGTAVTVGTDLPIAGLGAAAPPAAGEV